MFASHSQIICTIFGLHIYFYGVILAFAILVGTFTADYIGEKFFSLKKETIIELSPYLIFFGIMGARLYYCVLNYNFYLRFPTEILAVRHGGISIHGAILGGLIGLLIFAKRHKINPLKLCDVSALGLVLAQSIGRWGNFFNSEAFGLPTQLPWKLYIPFKNRPQMFVNNEFFHPTFLYESILNILIFVILYIMLAKQGENKKYGIIFSSYLILYSIVRIIVETFRVDSVLNIGVFHIAHITSALTILFALIVLKKVLKSS